jgi:DNA-binding cell septation regulator SpoVG
MQITNVTLYPSKFADSMVKAYGRIELDGAIVIDVNVIDKGGENQAFMSFPNRRKVTKQDGTETYVSPIYLKNKEDHQKVNAEVVAVCNREIKYAGAGDNQNTTTAAPAVAAAGGGGDFPF